LRGVLQQRSSLFSAGTGFIEHPEEGRYDSVNVRTDSEGNFTAKVMPGATYCAFINDHEWVSDYWTGILFDPETNETKSVELNISKGERTVLGRVIPPDGEPVLLEGLEMKLYPMDGESRGETKATASADGRFSTRSSAATVGAVVTTRDHRFIGNLISESPEEGLDIVPSSTLGKSTTKPLLLKNNQANTSG